MCKYKNLKRKKLKVTVSIVWLLLVKRGSIVRIGVLKIDLLKFVVQNNGRNQITEFGEASDFAAFG